MGQDRSSIDNYDVVVLGAGAAGLFCAITAARRGRKVLVLEKANKIGKKILMSGGGRCNFTNYEIEAHNYLSANPHFCKSALKRYTQWDFIAMVDGHGIAWEERKHGQLFCQHSAKDILAMLEQECAQAGVEIRTRCDFQSACIADGGHYHIEIAQGSSGSKQRLEAQSLVVATGALSIPTLGGSDLGYVIATQFGLQLTARRAGLVPFMFSDASKSLCERLSGLSLPVEVSCNSKHFSEQMLFTHRGLSGPAILQISSYWQPGDRVQIDLLPGIDASQLLLSAKRESSKSLLRSVLIKSLPKALVIELQSLWWADYAEKPMAEFSDKRLATIAASLNCWSLKPSATEGYRTAEVTLGGVDTVGISSKTMEAKLQPRLYFIGEVLDVSGHLGGYNFQWAWSSGYSAGQFV